MKKIIYMIGVCLLGFIIFLEIQHVKTSNIRDENVIGTIKQADQQMEKKKTAYLTFDDGPSEVTPQILEILKKNNIKATFFLIGGEITKEREAIVKQTFSEGHGIGVHTYSHKKSEMYCDEEFFFLDYKKCSDRIKQVTGVEPRIHRFPWGSNNGYVCPIVDELLLKLKENKVKSFDWNVSGEDAIGGTVAKATIYRNVKKDFEKYDEPIILLHDSATMKNTADVLGEIIEMIRGKGYDFDTLSNREEYTFPESWRK